MKIIANLAMWVLIAKARVLSDVAEYIPALSEAAHAAHDKVRDADLERRKAVWAEAKMAPFEQEDVYNGHPIAWAKDPNLEAALAEEEAAAYITRLDHQLAEWDAQHPTSRPDWDFQRLLEENLNA